MSDAARYRKKPVEIEAITVEKAHRLAERLWSDLPHWLADAYERGEVLFLNHPKRIEIQTLEGRMTGDLGDWIIRGVKGELYPCKPDIFEATYEAVTDG
jgi:hypothetical protein